MERTMRVRRWIPWIVLAVSFGVHAVGIAQVDDAPSLAGVIDIHAHAAPETSMLNFKRAFDATEAAQIARISGMRGIVLKEHAADKLLKAIMKVNEGEVWIERSMMGSMIQEFNKPALVDPEVSKIESLTDREREVIVLIGEGLKNKQVGERLFISETTVTHHLSSVFSKLEVSDRLELIIYAFRHGLAKMPK